MLEGRHAVVTGASRGIGAAVADALEAQGARVSRMSRTAGIKVDVTDPEAVAAAFVQACENHGAVDILVNNAGAVDSKPYLKLGNGDWRATMAVDLDSVHYCTRAVLGGMLERGWGRVINIASVAGLRGFAYASAYSAAKHAVVGLTRSIALEVAGKGVTVNAICPGYTETDLVRNAADTIARKTGRSQAEALALLARENASGRMIRPEEVAREAVHLCLPEWGGINGQAVAIE